MGRPVLHCCVVRHLGSSASAVRVERVKSYLAALLAASDTQLAPLVRFSRQVGWVGFDLMTVEKALAVDDPDLVCLVALSNERAQRLIG
jgi:hypothetical protein